MSTQETTVSVGVNAGGSHTDLAVRVSGQPIRFLSRTGSWKYTDIGIEGSVSLIAGSIAEACANKTSNRFNIVIAMSGAGDESMNQRFEQEFQQRYPNGAASVRLYPDSEFMLQVAYPQTASGLLVISGTGCIALSKDASGTVRKLGGWGRMLGDEGGGYWLGLEALKHYAKATDRLVSQGPLFEAIRSEIVRLAGEHFADFRSALYSGTVSPAHFAKIVFDQSHDPAAEAIISRGVGALAELVRALLSRADRKIDSVVTLHGSVATDPLFVELFRSECGGGTEIRTISSVDAVVAALGEAERS